MSAFTHLCKKFDISLAHNTITLYSKKSDGNELAFFRDKNHQAIGIIDNKNKKVYIPYNEFESIGIPTFVFRKDSDHYLYHDDSFNRDNTHYHMKFLKPLDWTALNQILSIFVTYNIISTEEKCSFLNAYKQANVLDPQEFKKQETQIKTSKYVINKSIQKQTHINYTKAETQFLMELNLLRLKTEELQHKSQVDRNYLIVAKVTDQLYKNLIAESNSYFDNKNNDTYQVLKKNCGRLIQTARPILKEHRGLKNILCNIGAAICGIGILYLAAAAVNYYKTGGKHFFFQFNTDSINKVDEVQNALAIAAPAA